MAPRKSSTSQTSGDKSTKGTKVRKQYAPVSLDMLKPVEVTKEEKTTVLPGRERTAEQKSVDETVRGLAYKYLAAGSPKAFRDMPVLKYTLPTEQAETVKFMIGKACTLLNCKPKFGRSAYDNGMEVVTFSVVPRDASQWQDQPETAADETADETAAETRTDPSEFAEE